MNYDPQSDSTFPTDLATARCCVQRGEIANAQAAFERALAIQDHPDIRVEFGDFLSQIGKTAAAQSEYRQALREVQIEGYQRRAAVVLNQMAVAHRLASDFSAAATTQRRSLAAELCQSESKADLLVDLGNLTADAIAEQDYVTAERLLRRSLLLEIVAECPAGEAADCGNLGLLRGMTGKTTEAVCWLRRALRLHRQLSDQRGIAGDLMNLAILYGVLNRPKRARRLLRMAVGLLEKNSMNDLLRRARVLLIDMERRVALREMDPSRN